MCDYSLQYVRSRPARVGDKLTTRDFGTGTRGFAALPHATAIFRQVNKHDPRVHHDALEFPNGRIVLLTKLMVGQQATVLQLPAQPTTAAEVDAQKRIAYVG